MTVSTRTQPDYTSQSGAVYKAAIDAAADVDGEIAGAFACHQQSPADMTVAIDAGRIFNVDTDTLTAVAATSSATITAPATNPRKDIVYIDESSGAVGVATGTEAVSPADPTIPAGKIPVARISLTVGMTEITNSDLEDLRTAFQVGWLKPDGDGSSLTNLTTVDQVSRDNIMLLAWDQLETSGASYAGLSNMVVDAYEDETGVDTATSSNETYDATNDLYHNPGETYTAAGDFTGGTTDVTLTPDGHIQPTANNFSVYDNVNTISGDFDFAFTWTTKGSTGGTTGIAIGFILDSATGSFTDIDTDYGLSGSNIPFKIINRVGGIELWGDNSSEASVTISNGDTVRITRETSTIKVYVGADYASATLQRTMTATTSADLRLAIGCNAPGSYDVIDDARFLVSGGSPNMALVSKASTAASEPSELRIGVEFDNQDNPTLGTDLILEGSIDNGSTWEEVASYSEYVRSGDINVVYGTANVSAQTGTSVRTRIRALNGEYVPIRKTGVQADVALTPPA